MGVADGVANADLTPSALFARRLIHHCSEEVDAANEELSFPDPDSHSEADVDLHAELEDRLEDLEDGLDVLMIFEKAFQKTMKSPIRCTSSGSSRSPSPSDSKPEPVAASASPSRHLAESQPTPGVIPYYEGSSTALADTALFGPQPLSGKTGQPEVSTDGAVIRIGHLGNCMDIIIRGKEIVCPKTCEIFTVPVQQDDILIIVSDGLSDNLWDKDILDEVIIRFRPSFMGPPPAKPKSDGAEAEASTAPAAAAPSTTFRRSTLAGMVSEALCSRANKAAGEKKGVPTYMDEI
ncbi:hypothetical protein V8D89_015850 [Ganoderma adspersum]